MKLSDAVTYTMRTFRYLFIRVKERVFFIQNNKTIRETHESSVLEHHQQHNHRKTKKYFKVTDSVTFACRKFVDFEGRTMSEKYFGYNYI